MRRKINDANKKVPGTSGIFKKQILTQKITELEGKIPSIKGLAATSALDAVENKIPKVSDLVKKTNCDAKTSDIVTKYFTKSDLSNLQMKHFVER